VALFEEDLKGKKGLLFLKKAPRLVKQKTSAYCGIRHAMRCSREKRTLYRRA
jgi:hypothetical protein